MNEEPPKIEELVAEIEEWLNTTNFRKLTCHVCLCELGSNDTCHNCLSVRAD